MDHELRETTPHATDNILSEFVVKISTHWGVFRPAALDVAMLSLVSFLWWCLFSPFRTRRDFVVDGFRVPSCAPFLLHTFLLFA